MKKKQIDKDDKKKNKRKRKRGKRVLLVIICILLIAMGWFVYKIHKNGGGLSGMLATVVGHDENTKKNLKEVKVLVLGVSTDLDSELTDTIMVASYNPNTQKANLLSIPRDTYTGKSTSKAMASQKINALYNINKNPQKTLEAVNEITGLDIKYYVLVRTEALIKLVDTIGGVDFNVPIDMKYDDPTQNLHINLKAGMQKLNGDKAEQLLRWRHSNMDRNGVMTTYPSEYGSDDFGRMRTQRDFITATVQQTLKLGNIFKIGNLIELVHQNVETNLELSFVKDYVPYVVDFNIDNLRTEALPGTTPDMKDTNNVSIFVVNEKEAKELIQSMFFNNTSGGIQNGISDNGVSNSIGSVRTNNASTNSIISNNASNITIELLNGSGVKSNLEKAKKVLESAGYKVTKTGNTTSIAKTIITNKKDVSDERLKSIKQVLGAGSISTVKSSTSLVDVSIVIGKDF